MEELEVRDVSKVHDQYCQYKNLPKLLKRFSFGEKMGIATIYSSHVILFNKKIRESGVRDFISPWVLETFVMLAMEAEEYGNGDFKGKNEKKFIKMCNAIWEGTSVINEKTCGRFNFSDTFLAVTGLNQFPAQENPWIRKYRYWQIFNDDSAPVHMKTVFINKFGTSYEDYLMLGHILQILFYAQANSKSLVIPQKVLNYLLNVRFPVAASHLLLSRKEYVSLQRKLISESDDPYMYIYSLSPSFTYAFVEEANTIYFPLPHLLNQCVTSSLLFRMTEGDNDLRRRIGKDVWEKYLLKLIEGAGAYEEVFGEQTYKFSGSESSSPDILARQESSVLFVDSKSTTPSIGLRLFRPESYEENIRIIAGNIKKLYNQMQRFGLYNPFGACVSSDRNDYWGIVIVLEDAYIKRTRYYEAAREMLGIQENSLEWEWMTSHIRVMSLYEIEKVCLSGCSIIDACRESIGENQFNFTFSNYPPQGSSFVNKDYLVFRESYDNQVMDIIEDMRKEGIL